MKKSVQRAEKGQSDTKSNQLAIIAIGDRKKLLWACKISQNWKSGYTDQPGSFATVRANWT